MALSKDDILNAVAELTVMELVDLISAFEEKFGVSAAAMAVAAPGAAAAGGASVLLRGECAAVRLPPRAQPRQQRRRGRDPGGGMTALRVHHA